MPKSQTIFLYFLLCSYTKHKSIVEEFENIGKNN